MSSFVQIVFTILLKTWKYWTFICVTLVNIISGRANKILQKCNILWHFATDSWKYYDQNLDINLMEKVREGSSTRLKICNFPGDEEFQFHHVFVVLSRDRSSVEKSTSSVMSNKNANSAIKYNHEFCKQKDFPCPRHLYHKKMCNQPRTIFIARVVVCKNQGSYSILEKDFCKSLFDWKQPLKILLLFSPLWKEQIALHFQDWELWLL